jgi:hypothetical protein
MIPKSTNELMAKLATAHPKVEPYISDLLGGPTGPSVFYPDIAVGNGPNGEVVTEDRQVEAES